MYQECWYTLTHAQTVYTRPSPPTRRPGDEARHFCTRTIDLSEMPSFYAAVCIRESVFHPIPCGSRDRRAIGWRASIARDNNNNSTIIVFGQ